MSSTTSVSSDTSTSVECTSPPTPGTPHSTTSPSRSSVVTSVVSSDPPSPSPARAAAATALSDAAPSAAASRRVSNGSVSRSLFPSSCGSMSRASVSEQRPLPAHRSSVPDLDPPRTASPPPPPAAPATCTGTSISGRVKRPCRQSALRGFATCARHTWLTDRSAAEPGGPKNTCVAKRAGCSRRCQNDPVAGLVFCPVHVQSECERVKVPFPPPTPIPEGTDHPFARGVWSEPPPSPKQIRRRGKKRQRLAAGEDSGASDSDAANLESDSSTDTATTSSDASGLDFDDDVLEAFEAARTRNARRSPTSDDTSEVDASEAERQEERRRMYAARFKPKPRPAYDPSDSEPEESEFSTDFTARQTAYFDAIAASAASARGELEARLETLAAASTQSGKRKPRVRPVSKVWERFKLKQPRWLRYGKPLSGGAVGVFKRAAVELRVTPVELSRICGVTASALEKRALFPVLLEPR